MINTTLLEFVNNQDNYITDMKNPSCKNCSECCSSNTPISLHEYYKIRKYLLKNPAISNKIKSRFIPINYKTIDMSCKFSINNKCTIYEVRPEICKKFHCSEKIRDNNVSLDKTMIISDLFDKCGKLKV